MQVHSKPSAEVEGSEIKPEGVTTLEELTDAELKTVTGAVAANDLGPDNVQ